MNDEPGEMWREAIVGYLNNISQHAPGGDQENH